MTEITDPDVRGSSQPIVGTEPEGVGRLEILRQRLVGRDLEVERQGLEHLPVLPVVIKEQKERGCRLVGQANRPLLRKTFCRTYTLVDQSAARLELRGEDRIQRGACGRPSGLALGSTIPVLIWLNSAFPASISTFCRDKYRTPNDSLSVA